MEYMQHLGELKRILRDEKKRGVKPMIYPNFAVEKRSE